MTSAGRRRLRAPAALPPSFNASLRSTFERCSAGARPKRKLVSIESANVKPSAIVSSFNIATREFVLARYSGRPPARNLIPQLASNNPSEPPARDSIALSTSNWRTTRKRPAPSAERIASSLRRGRPLADRHEAVVCTGSRDNEAPRAAQRIRREREPPLNLPAD